MKIKSSELEIKLCSDLCSGSGFSYAGVIDQDVTYDEYGFPYIPAKRIKGCMREAAQLVCKSSDIDKIFGVRETGESGCIEIGNAVLKKEDQMLDELKKARETDDLKEYVKAEDVLSFYTSVRAQTKIDKKSGTAAENTLRFTRVVNQYDPFTKGKENLCFYAPITWESENDWVEREAQLKNIAKATRNIGMNRNRGLGSVRCKIIDIEESDSVPKTEDFVRKEILPDDQIKLSYMIENIEPLVLSEKDKNDTATFISGKSVLGLLAGEYIKGNEKNNVKNSGDTDEFADLFLNGTVKYANTTPAISGERSFPVPLYLNQLKKTKEYVNLMTDEDEKSRENGNQPKKIKTQYIVESKKDESAGCYLITEPEKELAFHHRHGRGNKKDEQLYSLGVLTKGQKFAGEIYINSGDAKTNEYYAKILTNLLLQANLHFGQSKTSQYGACELIKMPNELPEEYYKRPDQSGFNAGDQIVVTLKSDTLFVNEYGDYTVNFDEVKKILAEEIAGKEIFYDEEEKDQKDQKNQESIIDTTEVFGYNTQWHMKRPAAPAIKAGSAFVYTLKNDLKFWPLFVGERTQEGFGEIEIQRISEMEPRPACCEEQHKKEEEFTPPLSEDLQTVLCHTLREKIIEDLLLADMPDDKNKSKGSNKIYSLKASNIGRLTLMLKESIDAHKGNPDQAAKDFGDRIQSIKSQNFRREAINFIEEGLKRVENASKNPKAVNPLKQEEFITYEIDCDKIVDHLYEGSNLKSWLSRIVGENQRDGEKIWLTKRRTEELIKGLWGDYLMQRLTLMKYQTKGE